MLKPQHLIHLLIVLVFRSIRQSRAWTRNCFYSVVAHTLMHLEICCVPFLTIRKTVAVLEYSLQYSYENPNLFFSKLRKWFDNGYCLQTKLPSLSWCQIWLVNPCPSCRIWNRNALRHSDSDQMNPTFPLTLYS